MDRVVVIANPSASQFTGGAHRSVMATFSRSCDVEAMWPGSASEASDLAAKAAADGADMIVAMGGDGMAHHVAQGVVGTDSALGVIPVGTTNVFARLLAIPPKPVKAAEFLVDTPGRARLGVVRVVLERDEVESTHFAVFSCGLGLDAAVVKEAEKDPYRKYRFGSLHYASTAIGVGLKDFPGRDPHIRVVAHGRETVATAALIQFRQVYTFFGRIPIRLTPNPPEPMTLLVMKGLRRRRIPSIMSTVFRGKDLNTVKDVDTWESIENAFFETQPAVEAQADGELLGFAEAGSMTWMPDALTVVTPQLSP